MSPVTNEAQPSLPAQATVPGMSFQLNVLKTWLFITDHFEALDYAVQAQKRVESQAATSREAEEWIGNSLKLLSDSQRMLAEMVFTRLVDYFLVYITELLALIYKARPETLRSREQLPLDFILQHDSMDDLRSAIIERQVEKVAFLGSEKLFEYCEEHLKLPLFDTKEDTRLAIQLVELRNIVVHNHGLVSGIFRRRVPDYPVPVGGEVRLSLEEVRGYAERLYRWQEGIDERATAKYNLEAISVSSVKTFSLPALESVLTRLEQEQRAAGAGA